MKKLCIIAGVLSLGLAAQTAFAQTKKTVKVETKETTTIAPKATGYNATSATVPAPVKAVPAKDTVKKHTAAKHHKARPHLATQREETLELESNNDKTVIEVLNGKMYVNGEMVSSINDAKKEHHKIVINSGEGKGAGEERIERYDPYYFDGDYFDRDRRTVLGVLTDHYGDYDGAHISSVVRNSPADDAGLLPGDLIRKINGRNVRDSRDLSDVINDHDAGEHIYITYDRRGRILHAEAQLTETSAHRRHQTYEYTVPDLHGDRRIPGPFLNSYVFNNVDNTFEYAPQMGISAQGSRNGRGVTVLDVKPNSPAYVAGLEAGDEIIRLDHLRTTTISDIQDVLEDTWPNQKVAIEFKRDGVLMYTYMRFTKEKTKKDL